MTAAGTPSVRQMRPTDVIAVLEIQEPGAVAGLAAVFPQDLYPFPRDTIAARWSAEVADPEIDCFVAVAGGEVIGFAARRGDELLHFGTALKHWGTGLATWFLDDIVDVMRADGVERMWLRVFSGNARGIRFYERCGWTPTGSSTRSTFPPYAELLEYARDLTA